MTMQWQMWAWLYWLAVYPVNRRAGWSRNDLLFLQRLTLRIGR